MLAWGKYIEAELVGEFYFFYQIKKAGMWIDNFFGDGCVPTSAKVQMPISMGRS
jgi:hypothetical protein